MRWTKPKTLFIRTALTICLLGSGVVLSFWIRSYSAAERFRWSSVTTDGVYTTLRTSVLFTGLGGLAYYSEQVRTADAQVLERLRNQATGIRMFYQTGYRSSPSPRYPLRGNAGDSTLASLGFAFSVSRSGDATSQERRTAITAPFWSLFLLTALYPLGRYVLGVIRRTREDRLAQGLCPRCGSALPEGSARCPGCDRRIPAGSDIETPRSASPSRPL